MSEIYRQTPGTLDIAMTHGEPFAMSFTINQNLTGYGHNASLVVDGVEVTMDLTAVVNGNVTTIGVALSDAQVTAIRLGQHRWYYRWVDPDSKERTILHGKALVESQ